MSAGRYAGKVALITGASRGIGLAVARRLVDEGARVGVTARKTDALVEAVESLGGDEVALAIAGSADDPSHCAEAIASVAATFGPIDLLVNNTGINPIMGSLFEAEGEAAALRKIMEVNVLATLSWVRTAAETGGLIERKGAIVNVASVAGLRPAKNIGYYGTSKAALMHLTGQLAVELAPHVRVNAVAPAVVRTRFAGPLFEGNENEVASSYPLGRLGNPEDVAAAVAFLGSHDAEWVTGQTLVVDGGLTLSGGI